MQWGWLVDWCLCGLSGCFSMFFIIRSGNSLHNNIWRILMWPYRSIHHAGWGFLFGSWGIQVGGLSWFEFELFHCNWGWSKSATEFIYKFYWFQCYFWCADTYMVRVTFKGKGNFPSPSQILPEWPGREEEFPLSNIFYASSHTLTILCQTYSFIISVGFIAGKC